MKGLSQVFRGCINFGYIAEYLKTDYEPVTTISGLRKAGPDEALP
jgi:hypothetical protein